MKLLSSLICIYTVYKWGGVEWVSNLTTILFSFLLDSNNMQISVLMLHANGEGFDQTTSVQFEQDIPCLLIHSTASTDDSVGR